MPIFNRKMINLAIFAAFFAFSANVLAVTYKWVDKNGITHFSQYPPMDKNRPNKDNNSTLDMPAAGDAGERLEILQQNMQRQREIRRKIKPGR